tara:strand:+ start:432 stop:680 length:249 start_codon:yes stop_codon:yes gene_type:complete
MTLINAYERAILEVFSAERSEIYFTTEKYGTLLHIESGSVPSWNLTSADSWSEVQELTSEYYGINIYIESVNDAQFAAYEVL